MESIQGFHLITPGDLHWLASNPMRIPNADFLEHVHRLLARIADSLDARK